MALRTLSNTAPNASGDAEKSFGCHKTTLLNDLQTAKRTDSFMVVIGLAENVSTDPTKVRGPTNTMELYYAHSRDHSPVARNVSQ